MPDSRTDFATAVTAAADGRAREVLDGINALLDADPHHRAVMSAAKALVACAVHPDSAYFGTEVAPAAARLIEHLAGMQGPNGLFDGENFASPPDTAFTVNDLCDTYALLEGAPEPLRPLAEALERIALAAAEPLRLGGVHTPNHRWELSSALARLHRHWPDERLVARIDEWLAEGVDIDADGWYSERSPGYALYVSNPSLTAIGTILDRPELLDLVCRNLEAIAAAALPDGTVETVHSRRQDQRGTILLAPFMMQFRRFAIERGRGDFAATAEELAGTIADPTGALAEILLEPELAGPLPAVETRKPATTVFGGSGLAIMRDGDFAVTVYGGSDYAAHARIRSGLATNPTFLRLFAGKAVLDSVRLSRDFFGLGPFRANGLAAEGNEFILREKACAAYYGPLTAEYLREDGVYNLVDEGRFSAAMDFAHRPAEKVTLETEVRVSVGDREARIEVEASLPRVRQVLELVFREGGELKGVRPVEGGFELVGTEATYRHGQDRITLRTDSSAPFTRGYHPGEDYTHLSGTDAAQGIHLFFSLPRTGRFSLVLKAA